MIRDPFHKPVSVKFPDEYQERFPWATGKSLVIVGLASEPCNVLDATSDEKCHECGEPVWVSPSSKRVPNPVFCCTGCFTKIMGDA